MEPGKVAENILSIECAVGSGSVAVVSGTALVASSEQDVDLPARAEAVLIVIRNILHSAALTLKDIDKIAVSTGPGSYSGIRIGMATALGLARASDKPLCGVSVLDALALDTDDRGRLVTAVAVGKRHVAWTVVEKGDDAPVPTVMTPQLETDAEFLDHLALLGVVRMVWSADLSPRLSAVVPANVSANEPTKSIAELIGIFAHKFPQRTQLTPQYIREQQFAKSR
ncbi:MAG TPA: tRNA (adenosine(37)-N6)-threonylcarbamoyltransferase complex dimerization subunit type 1 TsaB [Pyrinomonadaceae bacterium]|nr:tRNA (adenosine(37)-N6)-threonylcarbamoyltransferase complex dimerization subunit type 1 TsaB [Pyrinomonadaceae bacterium]